ncbi:MAG: HisA/HisF-related TIM barrel protein [Chloroflexi bacterium]|nr:HisA/HisF-related TIM barrel protein [Chloroflexota bacterium]
MQVIPSIDVTEGRSRLVFWPGASTGRGAPTDRPERIARQFVELGAPAIHLVDMDGARRGRPVALEVVSRTASEVAAPLQVAGGADGPEQIQLLFAAGATRVVMPLLAVAEDARRLRACLDVAGSWLAVGLDPRPERMREYRWQSGTPPTVAQLVERLAGEGVQRFVLSHGGEEPDRGLLAALTAAADAEFSVAGGVASLDAIRRLAQSGVVAVILGEALLSGRVDYREAVEAANDVG